MIISRSILQRLSPSIREAQPQVTDGNLAVPSLFSFVGLPPEPLFRVPSLTTNLNSSGAVQVNLQVANAVQASVNFLSLGPGYWHIFFKGAYRSNYVLGTAAAGDMRILMTDLVTNFQIVTKFAQLAGTQDIDFDVDLLLPELRAFTLQLDANGAGQEHTISMCCIANRLL